MTVGMLKEFIKDVPDDYRVIFDTGRCEADDFNEVVCAFTYRRHGKVIQPKVMVLQMKEDVDVKEEIESTIAYYKDKTELTNKEIFAKLAEQGFNADDCMRCSAAVQNMYRYQDITG